MKRIHVNRKPHLCLFAVDDVEEGEGIPHDHGSEDCHGEHVVCMFDGDAPFIEWVCNRMEVKLDQIESE